MVDNAEQEPDVLDRIVTDDQILAGKPVVKGTRIPVTLILNPIAHGYSSARIRRIRSSTSGTFARRSHTRERGSKRRPMRWSSAGDPILARRQSLRRRRASSPPPTTSMSSIS